MGKTVPNAIKVVNPTKTYYVARVFAQNSLQVGKVLVGNKMYYSFDGLGYTATPYEVLVCNGKKNFKHQ